MIFVEGDVQDRKSADDADAETATRQSGKAPTLLGLPRSGRQASQAIQRQAVIQASNFRLGSLHLHIYLSLPLPFESYTIQHLSHSRTPPLPLQSLSNPPIFPTITSSSRQNPPSNSNDAAQPDRCLNRQPQKPPFRFMDAQPKQAHHRPLTDRLFLSETPQKAIQSETTALSAPQTEDEVRLPLSVSPCCFS